jgi:nucleotide-binding universal stress UspA family protein
MNTNPVVIGVQGEQPTALRFAAEAALARGVDLHVVHAVEVLVAGDLPAPVNETWEASGQAALDAAKEFVDALESSPSTTYELSVGSPVGVLGDAAEKASLVVLGTDEADWGARLLTEKVTERMAKHADVPVAIVPEWTQTHHAGEGVYVAVDGRSPAAGPLRYAFTEASRQHKKTLHVIHALPAGTSVDVMNAMRADVSEALAGWSEEFPDVVVSRRLVFDDTDDACVETTKDAALLVLGRATHTGLRSIFGHPVIAEIARRAQCPSVVVPNDWKDT